jgi:hypothetical protein
MQSNAKESWELILSQSLPDAIRKNMENDILWFKATISRYKLMAATCDFVVGNLKQDDTSLVIEIMVEHIDFLEKSSVTDDTISDVNQRAFLEQHKKLLNIKF